LVSCKCDQVDSSAIFIIGENSYSSVKNQCGTPVVLANKHGHYWESNPASHLSLFFSGKMDFWHLFFPFIKKYVMISIKNQATNFYYFRMIFCTDYAIISAPTNRRDFHEN
jgi:hypothetical protein